MNLIDSKKIIVTILVLISAPPSLATNVLDIAVLHVSEKEGNAYGLLVSQFENTFPGTLIRIHAFEDASYKERLNNFITSGAMDIVYWQAGTRLFREMEHLEPLNKMWDEHNLDDIYSAQVKQVVSLNNQILGLPYTYYNWGFFYNKKVYEMYDIEPPSDLYQFIEQCKTLHDKGVSPLVFAFKQSWPVLAWFDYLSLRNYGIEFHQKLTKGSLSYKDSRVIHILRQWQDILINCNANTNYDIMDWKHAVAHVRKGDAAAILAGNFVQQHMTERSIDSFGYFAFPAINLQVEKVEIAPAEVWTIPKNARNKALAEQFIAFAATPRIQESFNQLLGYLPANDQSHIFGNHLTVAAGKNLRSARHYVQYFDRLAPPQFADNKAKALIEFIEHKDIGLLASELEKLRLETFSKNEN